MRCGGGSGGCGLWAAGCGLRVVAVGGGRWAVGEGTHSGRGAQARPGGFVRLRARARARAGAVPRMQPRPGAVLSARTAERARGGVMGDGAHSLSAGAQWDGGGRASKWPSRRRTIALAASSPAAAQLPSSAILHHPRARACALPWSLLASTASRGSTPKTFLARPSALSGRCSDVVSG